MFRNRENWCVKRLEFGKSEGVTSPSPDHACLIFSLDLFRARPAYYLRAGHWLWIGYMPFSLIIHNLVWQGTAAFWYNLLKSGEPDASTLHAACPVIVGTKWGGYTYSSMMASGFLLRRGFFVSRRTRERKNSPFSHRPQCTLFTPPSLNPTPPKKMHNHCLWFFLGRL